MPSLTRRGLFAVGGAGAASLAVAGCGSQDDPRAEGRDPELLDSAATAEAVLKNFYGTIHGSGDTAAVGQQFTQASSTRVAELERLGGGPANPSESVADYPLGAIDAQGSAIAAYRDIVRFGSTTELRSTAIQFLTQVSGEQATIRRLQNRDESPRPFVTGQVEPGYVASDDTTSTTSTTASSSTTTTSSTTSTGG